MEPICSCLTQGCTRNFNIEAISLPIVYNKYGDHDPNGLLYVLKENSERIQKRARENFEKPIPQPYAEVQPLVIRANVGDKIHVKFHNKLHRRASIHVQGLRYDVQTSDGANVGFNTDTTTNDEICYTWYAEREGVFLFSDLADPRSGELGTNVHGLFGAIIVEAAGSERFDPVTGKPITSGLFADIYNPAKPAFREYAVFFHDELEINNKDGQPPVDPHTGLPNGTTAISYRSEPMRNRLPLMTNHEEANFVKNFAPGALYTKTCPCKTAKDIKVFEIAAVQSDIVYNRYGWHDPQGRFFVLKEELEKYGSLEGYLKEVECGNIKPEPLVIRANAGDCIELRFTNLLPEFIEGNAFQLKTLTDIVGYHIHLVKFDTIVSDGAANGWNNIAGARRYETLIERFFANEELNAVFFHDHLFGNMHQQHGLFGALLVEPAGATFHDPKTGKELKSGTQAVIRRANGDSYREFALFVHDFALLFDKKGEPAESAPTSRFGR